MPELFDIFAFSIVAYLFLLVGLALVIMEMFMPGFGLPGIAGIVLLIIGVIIAAQNPVHGLILAFILLVILGIAFLVALFTMSRGALSKTPLVNNDNLTAEEGFSSLDDVAVSVGGEGVAVTELRPVGTVDIGGARVEASSETFFIDKGARVRVVRVDGRRVTVAPCEVSSEA